MQALLNQIHQAKVINPDNLMAKHFDLAYFNSLPKNLQTRLLQICKSGAENPDSSLGMYALSADDYDTFTEYFEKVAKEYHKIHKKINHTTNWDLSTQQSKLNELGCADGKLDLSKLGLGETSMRVRVGRNLSSYPLPAAMTREDRVKLENTMINAFKKLMADKSFGGTYYSLTPGSPYQISEKEYQKLTKERIMFKNMADDKFLNAAGISSNWPYGRGCYVSSDKEFMVWVGGEDHLKIMCLNKGLLLNTIFDRLRSASVVVEKYADRFARSKTFGFVTSCPSNLGTGMRASVHLNLPALTHNGTAKVKAACKSLGLSARGHNGEHTPISADGLVDISPSSRLMVEEVAIICNLYQGIKKILEAEVNAAKVAPIKNIKLVSAVIPSTSNPVPSATHSTSKSIPSTSSIATDTPSTSKIIPSTSSVSAAASFTTKRAFTTISTFLDSDYATPALLAGSAALWTFLARL